MNGNGGKLAPVWRVARLVRKELSEILRDRRTILTMVLMPLLVYPLLGMAFWQFFYASQAQEEQAVGYRLGFKDAQEDRVVRMHLRFGEEVLRRWAKRQDAAPPPDLNLLPSLVQDDLGAALRDGRIDAAVQITNWSPRRRVIPSDPASLGVDHYADCRVSYREGSSRGREAAEQVERLLAAANTELLRRRIDPKGLQDVVLLRTARLAVKDPEQESAVPLKALVPLILILMTITGAVYPAIDLTAGERERGTLEILVAAPVPRLGLLFAKYVSVVTVAVLTAVINLTAMVVTVLQIGLGRQIFGEGLSFLLVVEILALLVLFAAFFSALLLVLTSFARSFKEAQAYLIPLMLMALAPGLVSMLPGLRLSGLLTVTPLLNIVLLARDLLEHKAAVEVAALVVGSTVLYAAAAVAGAARVFGSESVLYSEQHSWGDLFRRPRAPSDAPTLPGALFCLALMFPAALGMQTLLAPLVFPATSDAQRFLAVAVLALISALLFGGLPLAAALLRRVRLGPGLRLRPAPVLGFAGALLLGVSLWPFVLQLLALAYEFDLTTLKPKDYEQILKPLRELRQALPVWVVVVSVVVPALAEELFFRGYLFSALRTVCRPAATVVASAVLFGLFHLVVTDAFALERFLPSTLLGLALGWVALRTGSVLPPMLLHACHNAVLVVLSYQQPARAADAAPAEGPTVPALWLIAGAVGAALGVALLWLARRRDIAPAPGEPA